MIIRFLLTALVVYFLGEFLSGVRIEGLVSAGIFALILSLLNTFLKPVLKFFGLPFSMMTFGLFNLIINTIIILLTDYFVASVEIDGFFTAFIFGILLSIFSYLLNKIFD